MKVIAMSSRPLAAALVLFLALPAAAQGLRLPGASGPAPARAEQPRAADFIVAVVNSEPITNNEVRSRMARFAQQLAQQGAAVPPAPQLAREVLQRLISEKAQLQLAREMGLKVDDAMVDQAEQNIAQRNNVGVAELRRRLRADGMDPARFREDLREQILLGRLRDRELESRVKVTELEVDEFMREQQSALAAPVTQTRARHILLRPSPQLTERQARERLAEFKQRIQAGRGDFAQLAREHSHDASAANGGDLGWANPGMFVPEFEQALDALQPGQVSEPVTSRFGVHLIQVLERRQSALGPREQRELARNLLREKKLDEAYARWAEEVRGRAYVELREPPQ